MLRRNGPAVRADKLQVAPGVEGCAAELVLLGPLLYVEDNGGCGGMNVTFNGVYRRSALRKAK